MCVCVCVCVCINAYIHKNMGIYDACIYENVYEYILIHRLSG